MKWNVRRAAGRQAFQEATKTEPSKMDASKMEPLELEPPSELDWAKGEAVLRNIVARTVQSGTAGPLLVFCEAVKVDAPESVEWLVDVLVSQLVDAPEVRLGGDDAAVAWAREHLGESLADDAARVAYIARADSDGPRAQESALADLGESRVRALLALIAGVVATQGQGDCEWLPPLRRPADANLKAAAIIHYSGGSLQAETRQPTTQDLDAADIRAAKVVEAILADPSQTDRPVHEMNAVIALGAWEYAGVLASFIRFLTETAETLPPGGAKKATDWLRTEVDPAMECGGLLIGGLIDHPESAAFSPAAIFEVPFAATALAYLSAAVVFTSEIQL